MTDRALVRINLVVVATLVALVAKEMDLFEAFLLDVLQGIGLVPPCTTSVQQRAGKSTQRHTGRENVEGDLTADREGQAVVGKFLLELVDERRADMVLLVERLESVTLLDARCGVTSAFSHKSCERKRVRGVTSDGRDVLRDEPGRMSVYIA